MGRHKFRVSTVFLGLDHNWGGGKPILFETMIFKSFGRFDYQERYSTWEEAEIAHQKLVEFIKSSKTYKRLKEKLRTIPTY